MRSGHTQMTDTEKLEKIKKWVILADLSIKSATGNLNSAGFTALFHLTSEIGDLTGPDVLKMIDELFKKNS